jgi:hypothetical protein
VERWPFGLWMQGTLLTMNFRRPLFLMRLNRPPGNLSRNGCLVIFDKVCTGFPYEGEYEVGCKTNAPSTCD